MTDKSLSTDSYKGVRDFYPEDMAIQRYIFDTWAKTAESFGFERYDASILEPSDLYKAKGAENEELVNEQTYTFTDRGEREVTLRPEMTPTVARMVAAKARELAFPLRWYSIPNLFRYERPQRGRLREHWQLNCDIFGADDISADVELIALAYQTLIVFGAKPEQFEIKINNRKARTEHLQIAAKDCGFDISQEQLVSFFRLSDKKDKVPEDIYLNKMEEIFGANYEQFAKTVHEKDFSDELAGGAIDDLYSTINSLNALGINNVTYYQGLARGFDYYTGTIFEIFEIDMNGNSTGRALLGGGRYDNLTSMFGGEPVSGIGFGMGDVTMRDFLETHNLIPDSVKSTGAEVVVIPETAEQNLSAQNVAQQIRTAGFTVSTDIGTQKTDKKKARAAAKGSKFIIVIGQKEMETGQLIVKHLSSSTEQSGTIDELINFLDMSK